MKNIIITILFIFVTLFTFGQNECKITYNIDKKTSDTISIVSDTITISDINKNFGFITSTTYKNNKIYLNAVILKNNISIYIDESAKMSIAFIDGKILNKKYLGEINSKSLFNTELSKEDLDLLRTKNIKSIEILILEERCMKRLLTPLEQNKMISNFHCIYKAINKL